MRCPKCGYISFDRQKSCGKCSNDLTAVAEQLKGTVSKAAVPFFLGASLGGQKTAVVVSGPMLYEEEEVLALDEKEAEAPPADEDERDFGGPPLDEDDLETQPLPSLGLEDIDFADLVPPQEDEEEPELSLGSEQEEAPLAPVQDEDESLMGSELPSFESDDSLNLDEIERSLGGHEPGTAEPQADEENEEIIDLSSLMDFDEAPTKPAAKEESPDLSGHSLGNEPEEFHLSLEDDDQASASADAPKKPASTVADIPDLGLTLENDDQ